MGYLLNVAIINSVEDLFKDLSGVTLGEVALFWEPIEEFTPLAKTDIN